MLMVIFTVLVIVCIGAESLYAVFARSSSSAAIVVDKVTLGAA
jgi:hypothetical protein